MKSSWVISFASLELQYNILEIVCASVIRVDEAVTWKTEEIRG
jgi:hypothetical protein